VAVHFAAVPFNARIHRLAFRGAQAVRVNAEFFQFAPAEGRDTHFTGSQVGAEPFLAQQVVEELFADYTADVVIANWSNSPEQR
jgi:hypothetical protein